MSAFRIPLGRRAKVGFIGAIGAIVLAATSACGSSGASGGGDAANGDSGPVKIVIAPAINTAVANLAADADTGEEFGVTVERVPAPSGGSSAQMAALISGSVDYAIMGNIAGISAIGQGADVRIVAGMGPLLNSLTISNDAAQKVGITADASPEEEIRALEGLKVVAPRPGSTGLAYFEALLRGVNLDPATDIDMTPISANSAVPAGLRQGKYDASWASLGAGEMAVLSGDAMSLGTVSDFPLLDGLQGAVLVTSRGLIEDDPEQVEAVRNAFIAANELARDDPDAAGLVYEGTLSSMDRKAFDQAWPAVQAAAEATDPELKYPEASWDKFVELFDGTSDDLDYSSLAYEDVVAEAAQD